MMDAFDADGNIIVWNRESTRVTGYDADEMVSNPQALERLYPDATYRQRIMAILTEERDAYRDKEWEITCKDGSTKTVAWSNISPQFPIPGWASWAIGVDVTERKQAKEQIQASLKEKEVLLKEIHHRVKNNLQIISSLLYLQSENIEEKATRQMFKDSQNRVKSMALIHEQLYQTDNLARIDLVEYIERLTNHLSRSWRANHVSLQLDIEALFLTIETAIPCGLIINELVTNAMKYAFPAQEGRHQLAGKIWVTIQPSDNHHLTLSVRDNGVGFPADINFRRPRSLGLTLVTTLVKQIKGTIELQGEGRGGERHPVTGTAPLPSEGGTEFKIRFPDNSMKRKGKTHESNTNSSR
jgi:PAS domain S-box-containing protein